MKVKFGSISLAAVSSGFLASLFLIMILAVGRLPLRVIMYNCAWWILIGISSISLFAMGNVRINSLQNLSMLVAAGICILFGAIYTYKDPIAARKTLEFGIMAASIICVIIALFNTAVFGWGSNVVGDNWRVGPRAVAMFALVLQSWYGAQWITYQNISSLLWSMLLLFIIFLSFSRSALIISIFLTLLSITLSRPRYLYKILLIIFISTATIISFGWILVSNNPFKARFIGGDEGVKIYGLSLNTSGRATIWRTIWESALDNPITGKGIGSSELVLQEKIPGLKHPHNDYLRLFHDVGIIGLTIFIIQLKIWFIVTLRNYSHCTCHNKSLRLISSAAFLALLSLLCIMVTDNPITYSFIIMPTGIVIGAGLVAKCRQCAQCLH